jgi:hypothetical protein
MKMSDTERRLVHTLTSYRFPLYCCVRLRLLWHIVKDNNPEYYLGAPLP